VIMKFSKIALSKLCNQAMCCSQSYPNREKCKKQGMDFLA
jgi:hypothetical protein